MLDKEINVVGGTYHETCVSPNWDEIYGSGGRAVHALLQRGCKVNYYSYLTKRAERIIQSRAQGQTHNLSIFPSYIDEVISFNYAFGLASPSLSIDESILKCPSISISNKNQNFLVFGMLEGDAVVQGNKVVYDPQSPNSPKPFDQNGSTAQCLALVLNETEAKKLVESALSKKTLNEIGEKLLDQATIVIIKQGAKGALLFEKDNDSIQIFTIPSYQTESVWKIGTGDVFSAIFAYHWIVENLSAKESADLASQATAFYAETQGFATCLQPLPLYPSLKSFNTKNVYLAGPFFTLPELWFIDQCRQALLELGLDVFSPYHDVGLGDANKVVAQDIKAIENCDVVFAILDGMDTGTIFEIGYARALGKKVVIYYTGEALESLKMMQGTNCLIHKDLVTALYFTAWETT